MTRIIVTPEDLQDLSTRFAHTGDDIQEIGNRLRRALRNLDWEARQRSGVDGFVNQACHRAAVLAVEAQDLSRYLRSTAEGFLQADNQGVQLIAELPRPAIVPSPASVSGAFIIGISLLPLVIAISIPIIGVISNVGRKLTATDLMKQQVKDTIETLKDVEGLTQAEWDKLNNDERLELLQKVEDALAKSQGRPRVDLRSGDIDGNGLYHGSDDPPTIEINNALLTQGDLHATLTTLAHESRHAYQYYAIENADFHPDAEQVESWRTNFEEGNYIEPAKNPKGYWNQPVERDARHFGDLFADTLAPQDLGRELGEEINDKAVGLFGGQNEETI